MQVSCTYNVENRSLSMRNNDTSIRFNSKCKNPTWFGIWFKQILFKKDTKKIAHTHQKRGGITSKYDINSKPGDDNLL